MHQGELIAAEDAHGPEHNHHDQHNGVNQHGILEHRLQGGGQGRHPGAVLDLIVYHKHDDCRHHGAGEGAHAPQHHHYHHEGGVEDAAVGEGEGGGGQGGIGAAVQRPGHTGEEGGVGKGQHLVIGGVDAGGGGGNLVIPDCPDGPAVLGADKHEHQRHADDGHQNGRPQELHLALGAEAQAVFVQGGGGRALGQTVLAAEGQVVDNVDDDHAEAQGDDGQIVPFQPQGGNAHQQADESGQQPGGDDTGEEHQNKGRAGFVLIDAGALAGQAQKRRGISAHGHEAAVAQGQLAQKAQHQIQRSRQNHQVAALPQAGGQHQLEAALTSHRRGDELEGGKRHNNHKGIEQVALPGFIQLFHTFSPTFLPIIPAGFSTSTMMRIRNTKVSAMLEEM